MKRIYPAFGVLGMVVLFLAFQGCGCSTHGFGRDDVLEKSFTVGDGGTLTMDVRSGAIEIDSAPGNTVKIKVIRHVSTLSERKARRILDRNPIRIEQSGNNVSIKGESENHGLFSWLRNYNLRVKYIITVPAKTNLDLETAGGSVKVGNIEGNVKATTAGGSLRFGTIKGTIDGETAGGSIHVEKCTGDVNVETSGGSIRVEDAMGTVNAETAGGSITVALTQQPKGDCTLDTSGGSIHVRLIKDINADVDAETSGGHVSIDLNFQGKKDRNEIKGKINNGGPKLELHTSGGSIHIEQI
ncbi:MAG: DUF4097 family beta strand repeat-containing protein [Candidatus Omnitrophota bacterium]